MLYIVLSISENHETDTFHLTPFMVCDSRETVLKLSKDSMGHGRFAVVQVTTNELFDFSGLGKDCWVEDVIENGVQFIFYDKTIADTLDSGQ